jgi:hypothetical protein
MVAGMIAPDIRGALAVAHDALLLARRAPDRVTLLHHLSRLARALEAMEEPTDRVAQMEAQPVPPHWRPQSLDHAALPPNVVPLRPVRHIPIHHGGAA